MKRSKKEEGERDCITRTKPQNFAIRVKPQNFAYSFSQPVTQRNAQTTGQTDERTSE
jgi:hypothetical protein